MTVPVGANNARPKHGVELLQTLKRLDNPLLLLLNLPYHVEFVGDVPYFFDLFEFVGDVKQFVLLAAAEVKDGPFSVKVVELVEEVGLFVVLSKSVKRTFHSAGVPLWACIPFCQLPP